jgi:hypothetical protein
VLGSVSSYGIDPHDIRLLPDGFHLAIVNYGSVPRAGGSDLGVPRHVVEAAVTVVELRDGRLVHKIVTGREMELRHLAAGGRARLFAIQALLSLAAAAGDPTAAEGAE